MRLDRYLGFIAGGFRLDVDSNPIGPEHLGMGVYTALSAARLTAPAQLAVVRLCEPGLVQRIGLLYESLERQLLAVADASALPQGRQRRRTIPAATATAADNAPDTPDWISRFFSQWQGGSRAPTAPAAINVHVRDEHELLPAGLHQLLQQARVDVGDAAPVAGQRELSPRELVSALSLLQTTPWAGVEAATCAPACAGKCSTRLRAWAWTRGRCARIRPMPTPWTWWRCCSRPCWASPSCARTCARYWAS